jgi:hypothetical protein
MRLAVEARCLSGLLMEINQPAPIGQPLIDFPEQTKPQLFFTDPCLLTPGFWLLASDF